jgi:EmrB/QacA subfamily drug resistance transporter
LPELLTDHPRKKLVLAAMIFVVAMIFIDQTIVAIAVPEIQKDLGLSSTGVQWTVNAYLLALSAMFALGGRLADVLGRRRMVYVGAIVFVTASALCGATPDTGIAELWLITFRVIQGVGAAIMFPAALAIVIASFPLRERGQAMAIFFAITGGLTSVGPFAGGYLAEWDWRFIFWINVPVAIIGLTLTTIAKPEEGRTPAPIDYRGAVLIAAGMGLAVLGLQQSSVWGWGDPATWGCIAVGLGLLVAFVLYERGLENPLIRVRIFADRGFRVDNIVLFLSMVAFIPLFFFASLYAQIALGEDASSAGLYLLIFFAGFAISSQIGGRMLDKIGARVPVTLGCLVMAVGFVLWARQLPELSIDSQWPFIVITGAGMGLLLGPANTDAINRAPSVAYGEATGITQTVRNFGSSLGLAILGSILISSNRHHLEETLTEKGLSKSTADEVADAVSKAGGGDSANFAREAGAKAQEIFSAVQLDFAYATRTVFYGMAIVLAVAFVVALIGMPRGRMEAPVDDSAPAPDSQSG